MHEDWLRCEGLRPRLARWLRLRFHWPWVDRIILRRAGQQFEDEQMEAVVGACFSTGRPVIGTVDDAGNLRLTLSGEGKDGQGPPDPVFR